jgi:hypothetical protein
MTMMPGGKVTKTDRLTACNCSEYWPNTSIFRTTVTRLYRSGVVMKLACLSTAAGHAQPFCTHSATVIRRLGRTIGDVPAAAGAPILHAHDVVYGSKSFRVGRDGHAHYGSGIAC